MRWEVALRCAARHMRHGAVQCGVAAPCCAVPDRAMPAAPHRAAPLRHAMPPDALGVLWHEAARITAARQGGAWAGEWDMSSACKVKRFCGAVSPRGGAARRRAVRAAGAAHALKSARRLHHVLGVVLSEAGGA